MDFLRILVKYEIVAFFVSPIILGLLRRRGAITDKQAGFTMATLISLIAGSYYLSLKSPEAIFSILFKDLLAAIAISLLIWVFLQWLNRLWFT